MSDFQAILLWYADQLARANLLLAAANQRIKELEPVEDEKGDE